MSESQTVVPLGGYPQVCNLCRKPGGVLLPYKRFAFHPPCYREYMERTKRKRERREGE